MKEVWDLVFESFLLLFLCLRDSNAAVSVILRITFSLHFQMKQAFKHPKFVRV